MASANQSEDEPPPLEDRSDYLLTRQQSQNIFPGGDLSKQRARASGSNRDTSSLVNISDDKNSNSTLLRIVPPSSEHAITEKPECQRSSVTSKPLRKGFLNNHKAPLSKPAKAKTDDIPFIKAAEKTEKVPELFKLDLEKNPQEKLRQELKDLMKPTQELVSEVLSNNEIQAGLEDPEIMKAVQDIAANPSAMHKYKHYPKIVNFYNSMGKLMGDRIEQQEKQKMRK